MYRKIRTFMEECHMIAEGESILAAVSGGADSICLLCVLLEYQRERHFRLGVVHVEHGIRGKDSEKDAAFVDNFCRMHKIPCYVYHGRAKEYARAHKMTLEEGARELRYGYFRLAAERSGADKIAVAHNQNDCAETMLFHLARGTGLRGMCGILPVRDNIIRPLLCVGRREIEGWLRELGQGFCQDSTNEELLYTRNKIRHQVIPVLEETNSQAVFHMNQTARMAAEAVELLEELTEQAWERNVRRDQEGIHISLTIKEEKAVIQKELLYRVLGEAAGSSRDLSGIHVAQLRELMEKQVGRKLHLPCSLEAERTYGCICLRSRRQEQNKSKDTGGQKKNGDTGEQKQVWELEPEGMLELSGCGYRIRTRLLEKIPQNLKFPKKMYTKWFDYDKIQGSMRMRTRREKDFFVINAEGARKKLKNYLIDEKVPNHMRDEVLLLVDDTHILWAIGYRISEDVKVTGHTKRILEVQVDGGKCDE